MVKWTLYHLFLLNSTAKTNTSATLSDRTSTSSVTALMLLSAYHFRVSVTRIHTTYNRYYLTCIQTNNTCFINCDVITN